MRTAQTTLVIAILTIPVQWFLPWWSLALVAFAIGCLSKQKAGGAFISGFLGVGLVWWIYAGYKHWHTNGILSDKVATIFSLPNGWLLVLAAGLVAAIIGGLAALSGRQLKQLL